MANEELQSLLRKMVDTEASDLFLTTGAPPHIKVNGESWALTLPPLETDHAGLLAYSVMTPDQIADFERSLECNLSYTAPGIGRFRISVYRQRGQTAMVARRINVTVPGFEALGLPPVVRDLALLQRGLLLVVGAAGSGKSTTLASMIEYRSHNSQGHILTVEDPIEYLFTHDKCTVDQREVGIDTHSFADALRNAMRQAPDMIMIGEIRDRETMEHAIAYSETGHLCVSTLHAANSSQALKRIINFFPENMHTQLRMDLSLNMQAIISQRLLPGAEGGRVLATETMLRSAYISDLILKGSMDELKQAIERSGVVGMHTFDQVLLELVKNGRIDQETALANADSRTDLSLRMRVRSAYDPR